MLSDGRRIVVLDDIMPTDSVPSAEAKRMAAVLQKLDANARRSATLSRSEIHLQHPFDEEDGPVCLYWDGSPKYFIGDGFVRYATIFYDPAKGPPPSPEDLEGVPASGTIVALPDNGRGDVNVAEGHSLTPEEWRRTKENVGVVLPIKRPRPEAEESTHESDQEVSSPDPQS